MFDERIWYQQLGLLYELENDYENAKMYYLMAINKGNIFAMVNLGHCYKKQNDYENMYKYHKIISTKD